MNDDLRVRERWFSDRLQQDITVVRWGLFGTPVLVFPSAGGDAAESSGRAWSTRAGRCWPKAGSSCIRWTAWPARRW